MSGKNALILGISGKVGFALAESLLDDGWNVHGAARLSDERRRKAIHGLGIDPIRFDVTRDDPAELPDVDVVFLEVWDPRQPDLIWPINYDGVGRVVERYAGSADIVNGCTLGVYGHGPDAATEETACRPSGDYALSRFAQEKLIDYFCRRSGSRGIHVRYAHANWPEYGVVRRTAEKIVEGRSLGAAPDSKIQVIGYEDFVSITKRAVDRLDCPPPAVNCCHPRVWTMRELAEAIHGRLGRGDVVFDREQGGEENSCYGDPARMIEWFGEPRVSVDTLIERVVTDLR